MMKEDPLTYPARRFWRLPLVRHVRFFVNLWRVNRWYGMWAGFGYYEMNDFDRKCLSQIWRGIV